MPGWQYVCGTLVVFVGIGAIVLMIYSSCMTVIHDAEAEAKEDAKHLAKILAEQEYQKMLATTQYRVRVGLRVVDDTEQERERGGA